MNLNVHCQGTTLTPDLLSYVVNHINDLDRSFDKDVVRAGVIIVHKPGVSRNRQQRVMVQMQVGSRLFTSHAVGDDPYEGSKHVLRSIQGRIIACRRRARHKKKLARFNAKRNWDTVIPDSEPTVDETVVA